MAEGSKVGFGIEIKVFLNSVKGEVVFLRLLLLFKYQF